MAQETLFNRFMGGFPPHGVPFLPQETLGEAGAPRRLAMVLAYDGRDFAGWQAQPGGRSVQGEVETALGRLCDHPLRLLASGRTDAGVHALGQVASFETHSRLGLESLIRGLQALLPADIHLRALGPVEANFHARYSTQAKTYDYYLWPACQVALFLRNRLWAYPRPLEAESMRQALALLPGEWDLKAFASRGGEVQGSTVREILEASLDIRPEGLWRVRLTATGFLRHVVRNLVGALSQVGSGRLPPTALAEMLAAGQRLYAGPKALPGGVYLNRVYYGPWPGPEEN
ncbi:tRNA pseudouridine synthase A [Desulfarculales bacterium]